MNCSTTIVCYTLPNKTPVTNNSLFTLLVPPQMCSLLPSLPGVCVPKESDKLSELEIEELIDELAKVYEAPPITNDPYMSPVLAPPEMLTGLPPVHLVVSRVCVCVGVGGRVGVGVHAWVCVCLHACVKCHTTLECVLVNTL